VHVRHLYHGQQSKQQQTHDGRERQSSWLCEAASAEICR
jgi:hypothetical protein